MQSSLSLSPIHRRLGAGALRFAAALVLISGCSEGTGPDSEHLGAAPQTACGSRCVLIDDSRTLLGALSVADSADARLDLGQVTVRGGIGDSVSLVLDANAEQLQALDLGEVLVASVDGQEVTRSFAAYRRQTAVYRFRTHSTVTIHYFASRSLRIPITGQLTLVQVVHGQAVALDARTPATEAAHAWAAALLSTASTTGVPVPGPGTFGGVTVSMTPYAPSDAYWGCSFQSDPLHGQSHTITIDFSVPVSSVTVQICDPDFAGNAMAAYTSAGTIISTQAFPFDQPAGNVTYHSLTVTGSISRIVLTAAVGDYVNYTMEIVPSPVALCPGPDGAADAKFDAPAIRAGMAAAWTATHTELGEAGAKEQSGLFLYNPGTGQYDYLDVTQWTSNSTCNADPVFPDFYSHVDSVHWKIVGVFHTHPNAPGVKSLGYCPVTDANGNQLMQAGTKYPSGPSTADWYFTTQLPSLPTNYLTGAPVDGYIMDPGHVYRYNGITTPSQQLSDTKWHSYNPKSSTGCP